MAGRLGALVLARDQLRRPGLCLDPSEAFFEDAQAFGFFRDQGGRLLLFSGLVQRRVGHVQEVPADHACLGPEVFLDELLLAGEDLRREAGDFLVSRAYLLGGERVFSEACESLVHLGVFFRERFAGGFVRGLFFFERVDAREEVLDELLVLQRGFDDGVCLGVEQQTRSGLLVGCFEAQRDDGFGSQDFGGAFGGFFDVEVSVARVLR